MQIDCNENFFHSTELGKKSNLKNLEKLKKKYNKQILNLEPIHSPDISLKQFFESSNFEDIFLENDQDFFAVVEENTIKKKIKYLIIFTMLEETQQIKMEILIKDKLIIDVLFNELVKDSVDLLIKEFKVQLSKKAFLKFD